jgi:hypothetical protein
LRLAISMVQTPWLLIFSEFYLDLFPEVSK